MGQKSNTLTLKNLQKDLSFLETNKESKKFLYGSKFLRFLEQLLSRKNILVTNKTMNFSNNEYFLSLVLFFKAAKLSFYKKKIAKKIKQPKNLNKKIIPLFFNEFNLLKTNIACLNIKVINKEVNNNFVKFFYQKIGRFVGVLFSRRFNLFVDFIKVISLFAADKVPVQTFLSVLGQIFKILPKRKHNRFLFFLKFLFQLLILNKENKNTFSNIYGIKFIVNGKLQGKTRADSSCIQIGAVPIQSIDKNVEFSRLHVYTLYGAFGFRIWVYRKNSN